METSLSSWSAREPASRRSARFLRNAPRPGAREGTGSSSAISGDRDFLYRQELEKYQQDGVLTRLDAAFSRDTDEKVYVQHKMIQNGAELFRWLEEGGHFYVCGDAKRMAADVDKALRQVIAEHGGMSAADADKYVANLVRAGRYQRDVY